MKCRNCQVEVPPTFAKALIDNRCPACGKEIMGNADFKEMLQLRKMLGGLQLDEKTIITIAAALSSRFDLVPKETRDGYGAEAADPTTVSADEEEQEELSPENKLRQQAYLAAKREREAEEERAVIEDWGLEHGEYSGAASRGKPIKNGSSEFDGMFEDTGLPDSEFDAMPPTPFKSGNQQLAAERSIRLARAEALRNSGGFRRSD